MRDTGSPMPGVGGSNCMSSASPPDVPTAVPPPHSYGDYGGYAAKLAHFIQKVPKVCVGATQIIQQQLCQIMHIERLVT